MPSRRSGAALKQARNASQDKLSVFFPKLGIDFRKVKSLYDIKERDALFYRVQFVLEHCDKERYKKFRSGKLSLMQCISRIEGESKNGVHYKVLDDFIEEIGEDVLKNPPAAIKRAYQEIAIEEKLLKDAKKRGIDPKILKATARNLNI